MRRCAGVCGSCSCPVWTAQLRQLSLTVHVEYTKHTPGHSWTEMVLMWQTERGVLQLRSTYSKGGPRPARLVMAICGHSQNACESTEMPFTPELPFNQLKRWRLGTGSCTSLCPPTTLDNASFGDWAGGLANASSVSGDAVGAGHPKDANSGSLGNKNLRVIVRNLASR